MGVFVSAFSRRCIRKSNNIFGGPINIRSILRTGVDLLGAGMQRAREAATVRPFRIVKRGNSVDIDVQ